MTDFTFKKIVGSFDETKDKYGFWKRQIENQINKTYNPTYRRGPLRCSNCFITDGGFWRRNEDGKPVCDPCGFYYKTYKVNVLINFKK